MVKAATEDREELQAVTVDATGMHYRQLNQRVRELAAQGRGRIVLDGVNGQRYIGGGMKGDVTIVVNGLPGNGLGAFMDGPSLVVNDSAQDGVGNTMNDGRIVIKGHVGDVLGYAMRGGKIFVTGDVGYRVGVHMKSYKDQVPVIVAGGNAGDFFGEYMAGGLLVLLGLGSGDQMVSGSHLGTGMHGGTILVRGEVMERQLGREVRVYTLSDDDRRVLEGLLEEFESETGMDLSGVGVDDFAALRPHSHRPYGNLYCY